jgi:uncharacterized protein YndB with AHSA1/START domain
MPGFTERISAAAPPARVWRLLYDPRRFPDWWAGVERVETAAAPGEPFTIYPEGYPDFPMPQLLATAGDGRRVEISCLVSDLRFAWTLESPGDGDGTEITVQVELPEAEAARLEPQRALMRRSLARLAELAERDEGAATVRSGS